MMQKSGISRLERGGGVNGGGLPQQGEETTSESSRSSFSSVGSDPHSQCIEHQFISGGNGRGDGRRQRGGRNSSRAVLDGILRGLAVVGRMAVNLCMWLCKVVVVSLEKCFDSTRLLALWAGDSMKGPSPPVVQLNALLYGLQRSGRTSVLYQMKLEEFIPTIPTVETIREDFTFAVGPSDQTVRLLIWDVGRRDAVIPAWRHHHWATDCVIFVIDSKDRRRINEAREELFELMFEDHFQRGQSRFLIMANKQDVVGALSRKEVESLLCLPNEMRQRWKVVGTSAVTGHGLKDAIRWLALTSSVGSTLQGWDAYSCMTDVANRGGRQDDNSPNVIEFRALEPQAESPGTTSSGGAPGGSLGLRWIVDRGIESSGLRQTRSYATDGRRVDASVDLKQWEGARGQGFGKGGKANESSEGEVCGGMSSSMLSSGGDWGWRRDMRSFSCSSSSRNSVSSYGNNRDGDVAVDVSGLGGMSTQKGKVDESHTAVDMGFREARHSVSPRGTNGKVWRENMREANGQGQKVNRTVDSGGGLEDSEHLPEGSLGASLGIVKFDKDSSISQPNQPNGATVFGKRVLLS